MTIHHEKKAAPAAARQTTEQAWAELVATRPHLTPVFDPSTLADLPTPAQRLLARALPEGTPLRPSVELEMEGSIKLRRWWLPFRARQLLEADSGFVWQPEVGRKFLRFEGADVLCAAQARMEFRAYGRIPVVSESGRDIARSAAGRLAAETAAWVPQALTPQLGAEWSPIDDTTARVHVEAGGERVGIDVTVARDGRLVALGLLRWGSPDAEPPAWHRFGGLMTGEYTTPDGVRIAGRGSVGWWYGTNRWADGEFFRFGIRSARHPGPVTGEPASK